MAVHVVVEDVQTTLSHETLDRSIPESVEFEDNRESRGHARGSNASLDAINSTRRALKASVHATVLRLIVLYSVLVQTASVAGISNLLVLNHGIRESLDPT